MTGPPSKTVWAEADDISEASEEGRDELEEEIEEEEKEEEEDEENEDRGGETNAPLPFIVVAPVPIMSSPEPVTSSAPEADEEESADEEMNTIPEPTPKAEDEDHITMPEPTPTRLPLPISPLLMTSTAAVAVCGPSSLTSRSGTRLTEPVSTVGTGGTAVGFGAKLQAERAMARRTRGRRRIGGA